MKTERRSRWSLTPLLIVLMAMAGTIASTASSTRVSIHYGSSNTQSKRTKPASRALKTSTMFTATPVTAMSTSEVTRSSRHSTLTEDHVSNHVASPTSTTSTVASTGSSSSLPSSQAARSNGSVTANSLTSQVLSRLFSSSTTNTDNGSASSEVSSNLSTKHASTSRPGRNQTPTSDKNLQTSSTTVAAWRSSPSMLMQTTGTPSKFKEIFTIPMISVTSVCAVLLVLFISSCFVICRMKRRLKRSQKINYTRDRDMTELNHVLEPADGNFEANIEQPSTFYPPVSSQFSFEEVESPFSVPGPIFGNNTVPETNTISTPEKDQNPNGSSSGPSDAPPRKDLVQRSASSEPPAAPPRRDLKKQRSSKKLLTPQPLVPLHAEMLPHIDQIMKDNTNGVTDKDELDSLHASSGLPTVTEMPNKNKVVEEDNSTDKSTHISFESENQDFTVHFTKRSATETDTITANKKSANRDDENTRPKSSGSDYAANSYNLDMIDEVFDQDDEYEEPIQSKQAGLRKPQNNLNTFPDVKSGLPPQTGILTSSEDEELGLYDDLDTTDHAPGVASKQPKPFDVELIGPDGPPDFPAPEPPPPPPPPRSASNISIKSGILSAVQENFDEHDDEPGEYEDFDAVNVTKLNEDKNSRLQSFSKLGFDLKEDDSDDPGDYEEFESDSMAELRRARDSKADMSEMNTAPITTNDKLEKCVTRESAWTNLSKQLSEHDEFKVSPTRKSIEKEEGGFGEVPTARSNIDLDNETSATRSRLEKIGTMEDMSEARLEKRASAENMFIGEVSKLGGYHSTNNELVDAAYIAGTAMKIAPPGPTISTAVDEQTRYENFPAEIEKTDPDIEYRKLRTTPSCSSFEIIQDAAGEEEKPLNGHIPNELQHDSEMHLQMTQGSEFTDSLQENIDTYEDSGAISLKFNTSLRLNPEDLWSEINSRVSLNHDRADAGHFQNEQSLVTLSRDSDDLDEVDV